MYNKKIKWKLVEKIPSIMFGLENEGQITTFEGWQRRKLRREKYKKYLLIIDLINVWTVNKINEMVWREEKRIWKRKWVKERNKRDSK
jgi:ADP-heptose:LPS heptosyltransferase